MSILSFFKRGWRWYLLIWAFFLLSAFGLFWLWNLGSEVARQTWWRVSILYPTVFDADIYHNWFQRMLYELSYGAHFRILEYPFRVGWRVFSALGFSMPEYQLITTSLSLALAVRATEGVLRQWRVESTWMRVYAFASIVAFCLTLGIRPAAYSWYLPFFLFALWAVSLAEQALSERRLLIALGYAFLALVLSFLYPWFWVFTGMWLLLLAVCHFVPRNPWVWSGVFVCMCLLAISAGWAAAGFLVTHVSQGVLDMYGRGGIVASRLFMLSNTWMAMGLWILSSGLWYRRYLKDRVFRLLWIGWLTVFLLWMHTPFTGFYTQNDHFRFPAAVLGFLTLGYVLYKKRDEVTRASFWERAVAWSCLVVASGFCLYYVQQGIRAHGLPLLSTVHLTLWFTLMVTTARFIFSQPRRSSFFSSTSIIGLCSIGVFGWVSLFFSGKPVVAHVQPYLPVIDWVQRETSPEARLCSDGDLMTVLPTHTGRLTYPSFFITHDRYTDEHLETVVRLFERIRPAQTPSEVEERRFFSELLHRSTCTQYAPWLRWLPKTFLSTDQIAALSGCSSVPYILPPPLPSDYPILQQTCDYIITTVDHRAWWHLPAEVKEVSGLPNGFIGWWIPK